MKKLTALFSIIISLSLSAQEKTVVTGKLLGFDGKPMVVSDVHLAKPNHYETLKGIKPGKSGEYRLEITETGNLEIRYSGLYHKQVTVPLLLDSSKKIKLDVQLETHHYQENYDSIKVFGDFNNWDYNTSIPCKKIMIISGQQKLNQTNLRYILNSLI